MHTTKLDPTSLLDDEQRAWLEATFARNRSMFGGWSMEADGDGDKADEDSDEDDKGDSDEDDADDKGGDEEDWKAKFEAQQRINRSLERRTRKDALRIKSLEGKAPAKDDDEKPDVDKIREEARAEAVREALHGRVEDKIEAKARAFADPEDAVAVLLRSHDIDDFIDGQKVDVEAIVDALKELGEKKPHLLAQGKKFQGDGDGGTRKGSPARPKNLGDAVSRHYDERK